MAIVFHCNYCSKKIEAKEAMGGKWAKCPSCHNKIYVSTPTTEEDNELTIKQFDLAMANFPFSQENWWKNGKPKKNKKGKVINKKDGSPQLEYPKDGMTDPYERLVYG